MKNRQHLFLVIIMPLFFTGCYYDNFKEIHPEKALSPVSTCDTAGIISYSLQIVPILNSSCTQNCHSPSSSGHDMTNYGAVSYDAFSGKLYSSVTQDGNAQNMPQGGSKIADCDIVKIKKWVDAGSPQN